MPSTPTTKSQVQAYRFVLRRMQSALVRKDSVMLHDPMRTHSRATVVGVALSCLAVLGFLIFGFFKPSPSAPDAGNIVVAEQSGAMYVMVGNPKRLIPTYNLASARLVLMAQESKNQQGGAAAQSGGSGEPKQPKVVPDEQLLDIPRQRPMGIPNAPEMLPGKDARISPHWAVCDNVQIDPNLPPAEGLRQATTETTVLGGVPDLGAELADDQALLVRGPDRQVYLVYRLPGGMTRPHADVVRAEVDMSDGAVRRAFGLSGQPREVSTAMLNAIPTAAEPLRPPRITGAGVRSDWPQLGNLKVGDVFYVSVSQAAGGQQYYVITQHGIQDIKPAVADLIRFQETQTSSGDVPSVSPDKIQNVPTVTQPNQAGYLRVDEFPAVKPTVLGAANYPSTCLGWQVAGEGEQKEGRTSVYVGAQSPVPKDDSGKVKSIEIGESSPDGYKVDRFHLPPGRGAVVQSATSTDSFGKGPIQLITTQGIRYGVPDQATAKALGLTPQDPAPELIIRLLPTGPSLNTQDAMRTFDSNWVAPQAGSFPTESPQAAGEGGN